MAPSARKKNKSGASSTIPLRSTDDYIVQATWMYYHEGKNQNTIATTLGVSRASVVNYLQQARERGYVRITLEEQLFSGQQLSRSLCETFDLKAAYVLPDLPTEEAETIFLRVAQGAAVWLSSLLESGDRLGVSWGRTVYELAAAMDTVTIPDLVVLQLVGSMPTPYGFTAEICSTTLAQKLGASCVNLHAPAILSNAALAQQLRAEPIINAQLDALRLCNKAVFAAGTSEHDSHIVSCGVATADEIDWYRQQGAVGVVCGRLIDRHGQEVDGPLKERMMAVELPDLRGLDLGLLVATGQERVIPMLAVLKGGYATHVVTSASTARQLLDQL